MRAVFVGGSPGIGLAAAHRAAAAGWDVVVASRDPERADVDAETVTLDIGDEAAVREALVRTLAVELAPVRVNAVSPGIVATPTWDGLAAEDRLAGALPAGRVGTADDLADAIWLLLTNGFVTGTVLSVDGGHRLAAP